MPENPETSQPPNAVDSTAKMIAPGYPSIETIRQIDVTGWEPAAVFHPVEISAGTDGEDAK